MANSLAAMGLERTVLMVEAAEESDRALTAALAHWGCTVTHVSGTREALSQLALGVPALLLVPDGGSLISGSYVATVASRRVETLRGSERPQDVVLQRPVDPADAEHLLETLFGSPMPISPHTRGISVAA